MDNRGSKVVVGALAGVLALVGIGTVVGGGARGPRPASLAASVCSGAIRAEYGVDGPLGFRVRTSGRNYVVIGRRYLVDLEQTGDGITDENRRSFACELDDRFGRMRVRHTTERFQL